MISLEIRNLFIFLIFRVFRGLPFSFQGPSIREIRRIRGSYHLRQFVIAARTVVGFLCPAVRDRGDPASEPRQALIGATVVCPVLPRFPGSTFLKGTAIWKSRCLYFDMKSEGSRIVA